MLGRVSSFLLAVGRIGLRGGRGAGILHGEALSERPSFRGGGRSLRCWRYGYRINGNRRMLRGKGHHVYAHWGDVSDYGSSDVDSHDEISSSSDDIAVITLPFLQFSLIFLEV